MFVLPSECPASPTITSDAAGTATHLGRVTMHSTHCFMLETVSNIQTGHIQTGHMTFVADDGSTLIGTYTWVAVPAWPTVLGETVTATVEFVATGETGRFEGATGEIHIVGYLINKGLDPNAPPWPARFTMEGWISY